MFHYFVSHVTLQLCDILVAMRTAHNNVPSGTAAKGLRCSVTLSELLFSFRNLLFLRCVCSKRHKLSAFWSSACGRIIYNITNLCV